MTELLDPTKTHLYRELSWVVGSLKGNKGKCGVARALREKSRHIVIWTTAKFRVKGWQ